MLTWFLLRPRHAPSGAPPALTATAAALSASFTSVPYVEFGVAAMPNLAAYGVAIPTFVLIASTLRHRDRIPVAVLALVGVLSVHLTGGFVVILFLLGWWLLDALWHPVRGRLADALTLAAVAVPTGLILAPQFLGVLKQADIIAGHAFPSFKSVKQGIIDALLLHTRHLNDFPTQYGLVVLCGHRHGDLAVQEDLVAGGALAGADRGDHLLGGAVSQPARRRHRRVQPVLLQRSAPAHGGGDDAGDADGGRRAVRDGRGAWSPAPNGSPSGSDRYPHRCGSRPPRWCWWWPPCSPRRHYLVPAPGPVRRQIRLGDRSTSGTSMAMAYLATLPGAHNTLIGDSNIDGTAWMYAVADLHPLWTHYDFPQQTGPGYYRYIFWTSRAQGRVDPKVVEAVKALNIRYILTSVPKVRGFAVPEGLMSLEKSKSWAKIYDNGGAQIYEWRGNAAAPHSLDAQEDGDRIEYRQRRRRRHRGHRRRRSADHGVRDADGRRDSDERSLTDLVEQPAKVMRIGTMIKQLLEEVRAAPLDEASRNRLREIHATSIRELEEGLAPGTA